ncbi:hypothetical protein D3C71_2046570 [compost metagenome]
MDVQDGPVGLDEQHVERNESIPHPHGYIPLLAEIEQHTASKWHGLAKHKALFALCVVQRQFRNKFVGFSGGGLYRQWFGLKRLLLLSLCCA